MPKFDPAKDIPNLEGRVCLVTGANSGIGEAVVSALAQHKPARIYLAARSQAKAEEALLRIRATSAAAKSANIDILDLDLASLDSVKRAATRVNGEVDRLDILHLNGGVGGVPYNTTKDGYEIRFGTNYVGHALLTQLLMPLMLRTTELPNTDVRIISMSSIAQSRIAPKCGIYFDDLKGDMSNHSAMELYGEANMAKSLLAFELAKRYPSITSSSLHPGTVKSNIWSGLEEFPQWLNYLLVKPMVALTGVSIHEGAKTSLWCNFSKNVKNGAYYEPIGVAGKENPLCRDDELSKKLWDWTERELKAHSDSSWPASQ
jgi:NAD(P)-dependent dehydrogenase (short-subunit alcohol dehydrogenase family)